MDFGLPRLRLVQLVLALGVYFSAFAANYALQKPQFQSNSFALFCAPYRVHFAGSMDVFLSAGEGRKPVAARARCARAEMIQGIDAYFRLLSFVGFTIAPSPTTSFATAVLDFLLDIPIAVLSSTGSLLTGADASAAQNLR